MPQRFDAIIIGGGHNGLVTAAYLARAGLETLVLERRPVLGGACVTEEPWPGYKVSTLAYLCSLFQPCIVRELQLERFGYVLYPKDPAFFTAFPDGRHLFFWRDQDRTVAALQPFSARDAALYPHYEAQLARLGAFVETLLLQTPPNIVARRPTDLLALARLGLRLLRLHDGDLAVFLKLLTQSVQQFLDERFESDEIKATLATDGVIGTNGGQARLGPPMCFCTIVWGSATGVRGCGGLCAVAWAPLQALARAAAAHGAVLRTGAAVQHITITDGRATGVVLDNGDEIAAPVVVSNADPKVTFLHLVAPHHLDEEFRQAITKLRMQGCALKINLALDALPEFTAYPTRGLAPPHYATMHVCPSLAYIERAWADAAQGQPSAEPLLEITLPTAYDDSSPHPESISCPSSCSMPRIPCARARGTTSRALRRSLHRHAGGLCPEYPLGHRASSGRLAAGYGA